MTFERDSARAAGGPENYYEVLGLTPGASDEEIESAYADLSGMFAADRVPAGRQDYARRQRARLAAAYGALADPDSRSAYDARLGIAGAAAAPGPSAVEPAAGQTPGAAPLPAPAPSEGAYARTPAVPEAEAWDTPPAPMVAATETTYAPSAEPDMALGSTAGGYASPADADADADEEDEPDEDEDEDAAYATDDDLLLDDESQGAPDAGRYDDGGSDDEDDVGDQEDADDEEDQEDADDDEEDAASDYDDEEAEEPAPPPRPAAPAGRTTAAVPAAAAAGAAVGARMAQAGPRGGVALPTRREAAQITARAPAYTPAPAPAARPTTRVSRPVAPAPDTSRRIRTRPAPPPAPRRRRKADTNRFAYQVMTLVIGLVLVLGTVASVLGGAITPGTDTTAPLVTSTPATLGPVAQAQALEAQHQWLLAEQLYQQALQTNPQDAQALIGLARVYRDRQPPDPAKATLYAQQVVGLAPNSAQATEARAILAQVSVMSTATDVAPATRPTP